jgi:hypothetical protein
MKVEVTWYRSVLLQCKATVEVPDAVMQTRGSYDASRLREVANVATPGDVAPWFPVSITNGGVHIEEVEPGVRPQLRYTQGKRGACLEKAG